MVQTVGKLDVDGHTVIIFDHGAPTLYADLVTELEEEGGIVKLTFAAIHRNGDGIPKASVAVRIRLPRDVVSEMCRTLREVGA